MSIKRHTAYNVVGAVVPVGVMLVTLPLYLAVVGEVRYGVLAILWTLLGYLGLFDLGLGRAVTNQIAARHSDTSTQREEVLWTALLLNVGLGLVGGVALWLFSSALFDHLITVPDALTSEVSGALPWLAGALPLLLITSLLSGALMGREEFLANSTVQVFEGALVHIVPLLVARHIGPSLPYLVAAVLAVRAIGGVALFLICWQRLPIGLVPRPRWELARPLLTYGGWVTVTGIVSPLVSSLDRVIIGAVSGARAVTYYVVPFSLASRFTILSGSLASALFPKFSSLQADADRRALLLHALRTLAALLTVPVALAIICAAPFFEIWMGPEFAARAAVVAEVILLGVWFNCLAALPYSFLQGTGRPDLVARFHLLETVPYLAGLWFFLSRLGVAGAALMWSLRATVDAGLLLWASGVGRQVLRLMAVPVALLLATLVMTQLLPWSHPVRLGGSVVLATAAFAWSWTNLPASLKQSLRSGLERVTASP